MRLSIAILLISAGIALGTSTIHVRWIQEPGPFPAPATFVEEYGTATTGAGTTHLGWRLFRHSDVPRPMVLVVHIGEWKFGNPSPGQVCRDMYDAGYNCATIQYRLADPGVEMRPPDGDQPAGDHANYPAAVDDMSTAVLAARAGSSVNTAGWVTGEVIGIGGSAGGNLVAYVAADEWAGGDKLDCAVMLSGAYDLHDPTSIAGGCSTAFDGAVHNWIGCTEGDPACDGNGGLLDLASPYSRFTVASAPTMFFSTTIDSMPPNQYTILFNKLTAVGATFTSRMITDLPFNHLGCSRHAFQYWYPIAPDWPDSVSAEVITFVTTTVPPP